MFKNLSDLNWQSILKFAICFAALITFLFFLVTPDFWQYKNKLNLFLSILVFAVLAWITDSEIKEHGTGHGELRFIIAGLLFYQALTLTAVHSKWALLTNGWLVLFNLLYAIYEIGGAKEVWELRIEELRGKFTDKKSKTSKPATASATGS